MIAAITIRQAAFQKSFASSQLTCGAAELLQIEFVSAMNMGAPGGDERTDPLA